MRLRLILTVCSLLLLASRADASCLCTPWQFTIHLETDSIGTVESSLVNVTSGGLDIFKDGLLAPGDYDLQRGIGLCCDPADPPLAAALLETSSLDVTLRGNSPDSSVASLLIQWATLPKGVVLNAINLYGTLAQTLVLIDGVGTTKQTLDGTLEMWLEATAGFDGTFPTQPVLTTQPVVVTTPEPASLALLVMGGSLGAWLRRRHG